MSLEIRYKNGKMINHFYGRLRTESGSIVYALETPIRGKPPMRNGRATLWGDGDTLFETCRATAEEELKSKIQEVKQKGRADHLTERVIESKTGRKIEYVKIADLPQRWRALPRDAKPCERYLKHCDGTLRRFSSAVTCTYLHEVTPAQAGEYLEKLATGETVKDENGKKVTIKCKSTKTVRDAEKLLRSAFARLLPVGTANPFQGSIRRKGKDTDGGTIHRRPFTAEELQALFEAARPDRFLYPLIVTCACTGLRRGDACALKWSDVDLRAGVVAVKTSKTGASVEIPIFKPLREVLESALAEKDSDAVHCFPEAVDMLENNPDGLTWRFKKLVAVSLPGAQQDAPGRITPSDALPQALEAIQTKYEGMQQRDRMEDTMRRYARGESIRDIERETGRARSGVSADLHSIEKLIDRRFMPESPKGDGRIKELVKDMTRLEEKGRERRASILDWHALRATWVTLALSSGVPIEVCKLVTGHQTTEIVLRHYFKPNRDHLRQVLGDKLPEVLTGPRPAQESKLKKLAEIAATLNGLTAEDRATVEAMADRKAVEA